MLVVEGEVTEKNGRIESGVVQFQQVQTTRGLQTIGHAALSLSFLSLTLSDRFAQSQDPLLNVTSAYGRQNCSYTYTCVQ